MLKLFLARQRLCHISKTCFPAPSSGQLYRKALQKRKNIVNLSLILTGFFVSNSFATDSSAPMSIAPADSTLISEHSTTRARVQALPELKPLHRQDDVAPFPEAYIIKPTKPSIKALVRAICHTETLALPYYLHGNGIPQLKINQRLDAFHKVWTEFKRLCEEHEQRPPEIMPYLIRTDGDVWRIIGFIERSYRQTILQTPEHYENYTCFKLTYVRNKKIKTAHTYGTSTSIPQRSFTTMTTGYVLPFALQNPRLKNLNYRARSKSCDPIKKVEHSKRSRSAPAILEYQSEVDS